MNTMRAVGLLGFLGLVGLSGCGETTEAPGAGAPNEDAEAAPQAEGTPSASLRLEEAQRKIDRGEDLKAVVDTLRAIADDDSVASADRDSAKLALSRALAATGDKDAAIETVEDLLSSHSQSGPFAARELATKRLRLLLTGNEDEETFRAPVKNVEPGARMLASLFEPDAEGNYLIDMYIFGSSTHDGGIGVDIAAAKRDELEASFSPKVNVGRSISSTDSWTSLPVAMGEEPADMPQADRSMLVFYYDLGAGRVPSRYDAYLPIPSDDIAAALEEGDGLIALRKRPHAKPTLVIAAPRAAQLAEVEEALSKMTTVPTEPVRVHVAKGLTGPEIQSGVRSARKELRGCYESLLTRDAKASGRIDLAFQIAGNGKADEVSITEGSTLREPEFVECMTGAVKKLQFAATGESTKVTYPFLMTP